MGPIDPRDSANGIRTRVWALRGPRPSPLDDSAAHCTTLSSDLQFSKRFSTTGPEGIEPPTAGFGDRCSTHLATDLVPVLRTADNWAPYVTLSSYYEGG